jgi:hypothetical protein
MTAVEWLKENIPDLGKYIPFGVSIELHAKFQQALEMEKQQIMEAYNDGQAIPPFDYAEKYYDRNYKKDKL